MTNQEKAELID